MRSLAPVFVCAFVFASTSCACTNGTPPAITPLTVTLAGDGGTDPAAIGVAASDSPASPDGGPDFYACGVDSDCVAVAKASCCPNGFLEAVNKQSTDAYRASVACEGKHRMCPQYRVLDRRLPICGNETHRCEMVQPEKIVCNGTGANPHACPGGAACDATGHCPAATTAPTP